MKNSIYFSHFFTTFPKMQQQTAKTTIFYDPCRAVVENALQDISTMTQICR